MSAAPPPDPEPLKVLVVDDSATFRAGARVLLERAGIEVVGEASYGEPALRALPGLRPDVVLMDLTMPGMGGVEATRAVRRAAPHARVLVLTASADERDLVAAIMAGAHGYVLKDDATESLVAAVQSAARGESAFSPSMANRLAAEARRAQPDARPLPPGLDLGERDRELLRRIAEGEDNAEIAAAMHLSPHTVKSAVSTLIARIGVANRVQAAVWAVQHGLDRTA